MDILKWQKDKTWFGIVGGLRTYKNMIMRGDPDSSDGDVFDDTQGNQLASAQDRRREAHRGEEVFDIADAQVVTSESLANPFVHKVLLDIDHPAVLIPSTTEGHYHLLIDVEVPWEKYVDFMDAAAEAGILEKGFVKAARARGFSTLRMPWIKKELGAHTRKARVGKRELQEVRTRLFGTSVRPDWPPLSEEERDEFQEAHPGFDSGGHSGTVPVHEEWLTSPIEQRTNLAPLYPTGNSVPLLDRVFPIGPEPQRRESLDDSYDEVQGMMLAPRMSPQQFYDNLHRQNQDPFDDINHPFIPPRNDEEPF